MVNRYLLQLWFELLTEFSLEPFLSSFKCLIYLYSCYSFVICCNIQHSFLLTPFSMFTCSINWIKCFQQRTAQEVLTTLKEHPDSWTRVDTILEYSVNQQTKYYALQILENVIKTRWKVLPRAQCEGKYMWYFLQRRCVLMMPCKLNRMSK